MIPSIRQNLAWMGLSQGLLFVVQFAASVAIARLLSPRELGVYAVAAALIGLLNIIRATGLNTMLISESTLLPAVARTAFHHQPAAEPVVLARHFLDQPRCRRLVGGAWSEWRAAPAGAGPAV